MRTTVAIIGLGVIGTAQSRMFLRAGCAVVGYDPWLNDSYPRERIASCDFAVICVGTPQSLDDPRADLSYLLDAMSDLPEGLPALIRSTVPPGTTDSFAGRLVAHAPEFLYEGGSGPWRESTDVPFLILGGSAKARMFFRPHLAPLFPAIHECDAISAELMKYTANIALAMKVIFVNEMAAIAESFGADWEDVRAAWLNDPRITPQHTQMKGFEPGFGGRCWPKDLSAMIAASEDAGYRAEFLKAIEAANKRFSSD